MERPPSSTGHGAERDPAHVEIFGPLVVRVVLVRRCRPGVVGRERQPRDAKRMREHGLAEQGADQPVHRRLVGDRMEGLEPLDLVVDREIRVFTFDAHAFTGDDRVHGSLGIRPSRVRDDRRDPFPHAEHDVRVDGSPHEHVAIVGEARVERPDRRGAASNR